MKVYYFNRSRKLELEDKGFGFLPLNELLATCDVISTHLPKKSVVIREQNFK